MSFINYSSREINCKIVYYGPGLCGKTTNLQYIYNKTNPEAKGKMISLATETERTLFFDFLPLSLGEIRGFKTRFHLYTVPGQVFYDASRKLILKGVDGVVYVGDSQMERMEANIESLENLSSNLQEQGYDLNKLPYVVQYNKRDLPNAIPLAELEEALRFSDDVKQLQIQAPGRFSLECFSASTGVIAVDELRLGTAKENLSAVEVVGVTEHYDHFLRQLAEHHGWNIKSIPHRHAGERAVVSTEFQRRIARDNAFDMEFYDYARKIAAQR